eukprot:jgi/Mesvir1/26000/Mv17945-RA.1
MQASLGAVVDGAHASCKASSGSEDRPRRNSDESEPKRAKTEADAAVVENGAPAATATVGTETIVSGQSAPTVTALKLAFPIMTSSHSKDAWDYFKSLGSPWRHVAPMVDQSELPFRMLCRRYGADAAYTPMLHSRLFCEVPKYREEHFSTCPEDRPLFAQFCANDPDTWLAAARHVDGGQCDYVDLNLGCPQRIAKRGNYGAFLMDDLPLVHRMVSAVSAGLRTPVSCKIRVFDDIDDTIRYARMLESAGAKLLAVHGRTREQKNSKDWRANWDDIKRVVDSVSIPVLANGNISCMADVRACMAATGAVGVLSAESLLSNPRMFADDAGDGTLSNPVELLLEYLDLVDKYPVHMRMVRGHVHKMLGPWFTLHPDIRDRLNRAHKIDVPFLREMADVLKERLAESSTKDGVVVHPHLMGTGKDGAANGEGGDARHKHEWAVDENGQPRIGGSKAATAKLASV